MTLLRPPFCPFVYTDHETIYLEFEGQVLAFPLTEGGFAKALKHVPNIAKRAGFLTGNSNFKAPKSLSGHVARRTQISQRSLRDRETRNRSPEIKSSVSEFIRKKLSGGGTQ